jgi:monomeric isocitrate dehydrogenase
MTPDEELCDCDCCKFDNMEDAVPSRWINELDERQRHEVRFAQLYADTFAHGTDGHHRLLLIAKLADLLDKQELRMTLAVGNALGASV